MPNDTVRASATALPKSRRLFLVAGTAAALTATLKGAAAAIAPDDDAELLDLIRIWQEKAALTAAASKVHDQTDEARYCVPQPDAFIRTEEDARLCLCDLEKVGENYTTSEIEGFRHVPLTRYDYRRLIKPDGTTSDDAHILERVVLSPAAEQRGQEIVAAYDGWMAAREEAEKASGAEAAEKAFLEAVDIEDAALWEVTATPANSIAGIVAKARAADRHLRKGREATLDSMLEDGQFDIIGPVDLLLVSIAHDLVRLSGQSASPQLRGA
jgi:hypothetical protein